MTDTISRATRQILTVSKLNRLSKMLLETEIGMIWLSAEISNFVSASSGHWYFTLKDNKAQVRAAMFKNANRKVRVKPREGDKILVRASVGLYEPRGDYQLVVEHMESDGEGSLKQAFEALKIKLNNEGLFAQEHKQTLPEKISRIGVITSATGAAVHDILTVLARRSPSTQVVIYPSLVQGEDAATQLIQAIETANQRNEVDVILLTRGGGSLEDLWCFNNEGLARAIFASRLPIVSAVGHEIDFTIADFVADIRAATPSAGAELLSRDQLVLKHAISQLQQRLYKAWQQQYRHTSHTLSLLQHRLATQHPKSTLQMQGQQLDRNLIALHNAMRRQLEARQRRLDQSSNKLQQHTPQHVLNDVKQRHKTLVAQLQRAIQSTLQQNKQRLAGQAHLLQSISPLSTLARGYSITFNDGKAVTTCQDTKVNDVITTKIVDGIIESKVTNIISDS